MHAPLIDAHAHVVLGSTMGTAGPCGPEIGYRADGRPWFRVGEWKLDGVGYEKTPFMDVGLRLEAMDQAGITGQILSPNPLTYFHAVDAGLAISFCRRHNDELAEIVADHPDRLAGFAAVPMQDPAAAVVELERATRDLGLLGPYVGTDPGTTLDDASLDEFYSACVALDVPVCVHPAPSGLDGPLRDERMRRFGLELVVEFSYEEMIAVTSFVFGGVLHRHRDLDVCISHGGGSTPMHLAKLRLLAERRPAMPEWLAEPGVFDSLVARLWFDIHVSGTVEREFAIQQLGTERLVFGTNFNGWDGGSAEGVEDLRPVLADNADRLFRLSERAPGLMA